MVSSPLVALKIKYKHVKGTYSEVKVTQSRLTLCDPMDYTVHGILQARILECVAFPFSRGIFPIQGSNLGLLHCRWVLYQLSHKGSPKRHIYGSLSNCQLLLSRTSNLDQGNRI